MSHHLCLPPAATSPRPHPPPLATSPTRVPPPASPTHGNVPTSCPNTRIPYPRSCPPTHSYPLSVAVSPRPPPPPGPHAVPGPPVCCAHTRVTGTFATPPSGVRSARGGRGQPRLSLALIECPSAGISGADVGRRRAGGESWQPGTMRDRLEQLRAVRGAGHHGGHAWGHPGIAGALLLEGTAGLSPGRIRGGCIRAVGRRKGCGTRVGSHASLSGSWGTPHPAQPRGLRAAPWGI